MTLFQWVCNRDTEDFTVSDDDGTVLYDTRETENDVPAMYDDMIVSDVLFPNTDCPDVIITTPDNMAEIIRTAKANLSYYMQLARDYGMTEYTTEAVNAFAEMHRLTRMERGG